MAPKSKFFTGLALCLAANLAWSNSIFVATAFSQTSLRFSVEPVQLRERAGKLSTVRLDASVSSSDDSGAERTSRAMDRWEWINGHSWTGPLRIQEPAIVPDKSQRTPVVRPWESVAETFNRKTWPTLLIKNR